MNKADIPFLSAAALGELIRRKEVSPVEATAAYLDRIDAVDGKLHSYITVCRDEAMRAARAAEQAIVQGKWQGPLHGVPYAAKDQFWTKGIRTTGGSRLLADFVPGEDATVVAKLNAAGAILLGKLNMSEFATGNSVVHPFGTPHNPWDLERNAGTSSSGSGSATAAFLCATSLGEDTGGSIRNPANNCGLVGLRPTWGLISRYGMMGAGWSMDATNGVPDGMKVDQEGHVYCTGPGGCWVFEPSGERIGVIRLPEYPANCAWGGPGNQTMFFTANTSIYSMRMKTPGTRIPRASQAGPVGYGGSQPEVEDFGCEAAPGVCSLQMTCSLAPSPSLRCL